MQPPPNVGYRCACVWKVQDAGVEEPPEAACIAVAGPVILNRVEMTNRNWSIDAAEASGCAILP